MTLPSNRQDFCNRGLTIVHLPLDEDECPICREVWNEHDEIVKTPCNHSFHRRCITNFVMHFDTVRNGSCPTCRQRLWNRLATWAKTFRREYASLSQRPAYSTELRILLEALAAGTASWREALRTWVELKQPDYVACMQMFQGHHVDEVMQHVLCGQFVQRLCTVCRDSGTVPDVAGILGHMHDELVMNASQPITPEDKHIMRINNPLTIEINLASVLGIQDRSIESVKLQCYEDGITEHISHITELPHLEYDFKHFTVQCRCLQPLSGGHILTLQSFYPHSLATLEVDKDRFRILCRPHEQYNWRLDVVLHLRS